MNKAEYISLDLEMEQPSGEIIQVGIAWSTKDAFDSSIHTKNFYITPSGQLSEFIKELTGIKDSDFDWTKSRRECYKEFCDFIKEIFNKDGFREFITWGSGDVSTLYKELEFLNASTEDKLTFHLSNRRWMDVKTICQFKEIGRKGKTSSRMSLATALRAENISFNAKIHDAAADAENTLGLFMSLLSDEIESKIAAKILCKTNKLQNTCTKNKNFEQICNSIE